MESNYINESKENYSKLLIANGKVDHAKKIMNKETFEPVFDLFCQ